MGEMHRGGRRSWRGTAEVDSLKILCKHVLTFRISLLRFIVYQNLTNSIFPIKRVYFDKDFVKKKLIQLSFEFMVFEPPLVNM